MERRPVTRRIETFSWKILLKRSLCAFIFRGHKFHENLGRRSDIICLRCGMMFYTKTPYKKGKR